MTTDARSIRVSEDGPYVVDGAVPLATQTITSNDDGDSLDWREGDEIATDTPYRLCRCGGSGSKPFCDGSHVTNGFDGTETASRAPYDELATQRRGPRLVLSDAPSLCAGARFCDPAGSVWRLALRRDDDAVALARHEATHCPSGRLVVRDADTDEVLEPVLPPSIGLVVDPAAGVAGPLWVRGGVRVIAADGEPYEVRNRMTLCRCGASQNKPFCDGSHRAIGFQA